jgi:glutamyl-tRNA reductase
MEWLTSRKTVPAIRSLHERGEALKDAELDRARRMLASGQDPARVLESLAHALTAKFLHGPTRLLHGSQDERERMLSLVDHILPEHRAIAETERAGGDSR